MLCDELKDYDYDPDFPFQSRGRFYDADEVEAAIDELKQKLKDVNELIKTARQMLEDAKASHYAEMVDAGMENRKLKRALWLMTAEWAEAMGLASCNIANKFMSRENFEVSDDYRNKTIKRHRHRQVVFYKYADYCRKKEEEYR